MNIQVTHLSFAFLVLLLSSSCSPGGDTDGNTLPDGKYPLAFTSSVEAMAETRAATANGTWTDGDRIAVKVEDEIKEYSYGDGATFTVASGDPFYWTSAEEIKTVCAWYCGTGYSGSQPETWSVQSNQNADNGYQQSDFLYAPAKEITFSDATKSLPFYHQIARVVINIKNAEAATSVGQITDVVIGNAKNLALSGTYTPPGIGATVGTWTPATADPGMGTITPKDITASADGILKTYTALVIPQDMKGKKFLAVTLSDNQVYYYTPSDSDANLKSGQVYTYNITVKIGKIDVIAVNNGSGSWGSSGSEDITSSSTP